MTIIEKDATKTISWQSLDKPTQENLVNLCKYRSNPKVVTDINEGMNINDINFYKAINEALGCIKGHISDTIFELEQISSSGEGGIFEPIKEYIKKYREIEKAAVQLARDKLRTLYI